MNWAHRTAHYLYQRNLLRFLSWRCLGVCLSPFAVDHPPRV